jgi:hypothetical protein
MFRLRRRSVGRRAGIVAAVIGMFALTSLPGASATLAPSASASMVASVSSSTVPASTASAEGDTKCVPWPKPTSLGLKCTGTYSGNTAWDPYTNAAVSAQPVVTISQAKELTDQDVKITWSGFTPSLGSTGVEPNPASDAAYYQVSLLECNGTNPDWSDGYASHCYRYSVGAPSTAAKSGPPNGELVNTLDTSVPPTITGTSGISPYSPLAPLYGVAAPGWKDKGPTSWTGQAEFHVEAPTPRTKGGFFRCSSTNPCSLVIDPNWGGTPTAAGSSPSSYSYTDTSSCNVHTIGGSQSPGDFYNSNGNQQGFSSPQENAHDNGNFPNLLGNSWACWTADRIVIPLSFAPTSQDCPNKTPQFYAQGSPMMQTQMLQWEAGWCTGSDPVALSYTFNSESQARGEFLAGGQAASARVDMALVTLPADAAAQKASTRKFTYAPLANSGVDIAYYLDDYTTGSQVNRMVLNQRLLAKLTTQSYTLQYNCTNPAVKSPWAPNPQANDYCDPAVKGNPYSLFSDPEFLSLNTDCRPFGQAANYHCGDNTVTVNGTKTVYSDFPTDPGNGGSAELQYGGFLPTVLQPFSDMTYDLTGWIAANQEATSFLAGKNDQWGTRVNSNYLDVSYPVQSFAMLDNGVTYPGGLPPCNNSGGECGNLIGQPDESMQSSWNFQTDLDTIAGDLLTDQPAANQPTISCAIPGANGCTNVNELNPTTASVPELLSGRALLSEMDLGDIATYEFPAADLVNGAGKAVAPTQASVEAAVGDMKTNPDGITQYYDYASTDPKAYPLSMVDYAMVPTCGLSSAEASAISDFLAKAATTGQTEGENPGNLAPGYYPLTAKQKAQTLKAAREVKAQVCKSTPPDHKVSGKKKTTTPHRKGSTPKGTPSGQPTSTGTPTRTTSPTPTTSTPGSKSPSPTATPTGSPTPTATRSAQVAAFGEKSPDSGMAGILLLIAIIAGAILLIGGPAAWALTATGQWPTVLRWLRPVQTRTRARLTRFTGRPPFGRAPTRQAPNRRARTRWPWT